MSLISLCAAHYPLQRGIIKFIIERILIYFKISFLLMKMLKLIHKIN